MIDKTKKLFYLLVVGVSLTMFTVAEAALPPKPQPLMPVRVDVVNDAGRSFRQYPTNSAYNVKRAYIQATNRQQYNIRVRNMTGRRVGVVVTVDGRNILTGKKSWLRSTEKMYLLEPYQTSVYKGWRTGKNRINRFFFTESGNSYAGAWGDKSAMGVIAVAAFYEKPRAYYRAPKVAKARPRVMPQAAPSLRAGAPVAAAPSIAPRYRSKSRRSNAGTGFGRTERSDSTTVEFRPEGRPASRHFYKYEWRSKLCKRGIIVCHSRRPQPKPQNRFWKETNQGYAPPPPRR